VGWPVNLIEWLRHGTEHGYVTGPTCETHDTVYTDSEIDQFDAGDDPCVFVLRLNEVSDD
jgi:diaminopimelate decarboxylase